MKVFLDEFFFFSNLDESVLYRLHSSFVRFETPQAHLLWCQHRQWHISWSVWKGSSPLHGKSWRMANALRDENQKKLNLEGVATVGSTKRLRGWSVNAGVPLSTTPCNFLNRIDSHLFRVLLLRRLRLPLPLSARQCRCGRDAFWPSPHLMCQSRGPGKTGFFGGKCWCAHLRGSRRQSRDQCDASRFRPGCSKSSGSTARGDPGGRTAPLRGSSAGSRHHVGFSIAL